MLSSPSPSSSSWWRITCPGWFAGRGILVMGLRSLNSRGVFGLRGINQPRWHPIYARPDARAPGVL
jgi:hypothetical protein